MSALITAQTCRRWRTWMQGPLPALTRVLLVMLFGLMVAARMPDILLHGRFWAEEGNKFFVYGWSMPPWQALFAPWGGYLNITANLGGILAWRAVPLTFAPYATSLLALTIQLFPAILLATSRTEWLNYPYALVAAMLAVLLVPVSEEVWISSIGSQVHLSLCVALILALEIRGGPVGVFRLLVLLLAALSGPGSWPLTIFFAARAAIERSLPRFLQAVVLGTAVLAQLLFFYSHDPGRPYAVHPVLFLDLAFEKHVLLPLIGPERLMDRGNAEIAFIDAGFVPYRPAFAMLAIGAGTAVAMWRDLRSMASWLLCSAAAMICISYVGMLGNFSSNFSANGSGSRYAYAPQVLISLAVLSCAVTRRGFVGYFTTVIAAWTLTVGGIYYFIPSNKIFAHGPSWRHELAAHRQNPAHLVRSWPPSWYVRLPDDPGTTQ